MNEYFIALANKIQEVSTGEPIIYVPNMGNWGDGVIREATLRFFNDFSISYHELPFINQFWNTYIKSKLMKEYLSTKVLVFGGGGAWYPTFYSGYSFINQFHHLFQHTIVLPSTLMLQINSLDITFFCRDQYESKMYYPQSYFCHDMAFYIRDRIKSNNKVKHKDGYFFRMDKESARELKLPDTNIDLSHLGNEFTPITPFLHTIDEYETVHTDRLHVAIIACSLHKQVHFCKGSYFKNEAVFKSSMKDYFENVHYKG